MDVLARWRRLHGDDVVFLTGTDEHGLKVAQVAASQGVTPQAWADRTSVRYREAWAELDISYPERLSRWKAVLKPWLLAIPHYAVLATFFGAWNANGGGWEIPGLLTVLVVIAAVVLLVRGRYPRDIFALVVGINRWALRVAAYAGLMRDEYPPFRLDR